MRLSAFVDMAKWWRHNIAAPFVAQACQLTVDMLDTRKWPVKTMRAWQMTCLFRLEVPDVASERTTLCRCKTCGNRCPYPLHVLCTWTGFPDGGLVMSAREEYGERISTEINRLHITLELAAEYAGCSRRTFSYYLQGATVPNAETLKALDERGFDVLYIVTGRRNRRKRSTA